MKTKYIIFLIIGIVFMGGCAAQEVSIPEVVPEPDVIEAPQVEESVEEIPGQVHGLGDIDEISILEEDFEDFLEMDSELDLESSDELIDQFDSLLQQTTDEFDQDNFVEGRRLLKQAETLLDDLKATAQENSDLLKFKQRIWNSKIEAAFSQKLCETKPFELNAEPYNIGPPPVTYLVKVYIETTSLWTNVEVEGLQSVKVPGHTLLEGSNPEINVYLEGMTGELSRPEADLDVYPKIAVEFYAIVQREGGTATFRIRKGNSGTTIYKLYSVVGDSINEIVRFTHNGIVEGGDNERTFRFDLNLLSSPLDLPIEERYKGPLFDSHLHLVGPDSEEVDSAIDDRLFINPENAEKFFSMMDNQGVIGLIGFLPVNHDNYIPNKFWNEIFLDPTLAVVNRYCKRIIPFLYPTSLLGVDPDELRVELIDNYIKDSQIPFRGIGELHGGDYPGELVPIYAGHKLNDQVMLDLYDYAAENNLTMMIHPRVIDLEDLGDALQHNRKTNFLLHGSDGVEKFLPTLFQENENVYYSLDNDLLYPYGIAMDGMTKEEFMNILHSNGMYYRLLASALHHWKPLIEEYPDRMMWGTDALYTWHFDHDLYSEVTWFTRDFIGRLSPEVQEKFAYQNAEELLAVQ